MSRFEPHFLDEIKQRIRITEVVGQHVLWDKKKSNPGRGDMWACCPFHGEKSPSFHADDKRGIYHCLAAETRVITWDGHQLIADLAGTTAMILTRGGAWTLAEFKSYGVQPLFAIELSRNGVRKTIRATSQHRWFARDRISELTTADLKKGMRLEAALPPAPSLWAMSQDGLRHGIVFGDGTRCGKKSRAYLCGDKVTDLLSLFADFKVYKYMDRHTVDGLPLEYRSLPSLDSPLEYLRGFVSGLLATDGHVAKDGTIILNQKDVGVLEFVRVALMRLGVPTYPITTQSRIGFGGIRGNISRIHISTEAMPPDAFIRPSQRERHAKGRKKFERWRWVVQSVSAEPIAFEEVYCAQVPVEHAFALEDNLLTGNCFGCGVSGDHFKFLTDSVGMSFPAAVEDLAQQAGVEMPNDHKHRQQSPEERAKWQSQQDEKRRTHEKERAKLLAVEEKKKQRKVDTAQSIFGEIGGIGGTAADLYLINRGLPPVAEWPWNPDEVLRFHPGLEYELGSVWEGDRKVKPGPMFPALVAAVRDSFGDLVALWRIFITPDGHKAPVDNAKVGFGPAAGGAVRLGGDGPNIGVGEGIETCLSAWFLNGCHKPVWACLSTSGMTGFEIPSFVKRLEIFPDGDKAKVRETKDGHFAMSDRPGMAAAKGLEAEAVPILGRENVTIAPEPAAGTDFNDLYVDMKAKGLI